MVRAITKDDGKYTSKQEYEPFARTQTRQVLFFVQKLAVSDISVVSVSTNAIKSVCCADFERNDTVTIFSVCAHRLISQYFPDD